jgi:hypothetical protein
LGGGVLVAGDEQARERREVGRQRGAPALLLGVETEGGVPDVHRALPEARMKFLRNVSAEVVGNFATILGDSPRLIKLGGYVLLQFTSTQSRHHSFDRASQNSTKLGHGGDAEPL